MNMVEKVARALHEHGVDPKNGYSWDDASSSEKDHAKGYARAALEAMREPTDVMIGCGILAYDGKCEQSYRAMIDAALKEVK